MRGGRVDDANWPIDAGFKKGMWTCLIQQTI